MKQVAVIGCGMVGQLIARDLSQSFEVTAIDRSEQNLAQLGQFPGITTVSSEIRHPGQCAKAVKDADIVALALPGSIGFEVLKILLELGKPVVDISFFPEDPFPLESVAVQNGTFAVVDCGIAPGYSHLAAGYYSNFGLKGFYCYVGGLPKARVKPFEYKAPFSPADVVEEYLRPARYKKRGEILTANPLTMTEQLALKGTGTLEAFISDGLRTLLHTLPEVHTMQEKTLRYPGHSNLVQLLKDIGFFSEKPVEVNGQTVTPRKLTEALLFEHWKLEQQEPEFTYMKLVLKGNTTTVDWERIIELYDERDEKTGYSSMTRTTAYNCTGMIRFLAEHGLPSPGIYPPELIAANGNAFRFITDYLKAKGISIVERATETPSARSSL